MKVLVIGSHGKVGKRLIKKLKKHHHEVLAMIRDESQTEEIEKTGAKAIVADLEKDFGFAYGDHLDAVVFTAGSGGHTGKDKTIAVDLQGAKKSIDEAVRHKVSRYIMVSALGADDPMNIPGNLQHYFVAKAEADEHLAQTQLNYTIFRPGTLTDEAGIGSIQAAEKLQSYNSRDTRRDDLAEAIAVSIDKPNTYKKVIELVNGNTPVNEAIKSI